MRRAKKSPVWDHFEESKLDPSQAICKHCKENVFRSSKEKRGMTLVNMKNHLKVKHKEEYETFSKKDEENNEIEKKRKIEEANAAASGVMGDMRNNAEKKQRFLNQSLPEYIAGKQPWPKGDPRHNTVDKAVLRKMIIDLTPFHEVNKPGFIQFVKVLEPRAKLKSDKFYGDMMRKSYTTCKEKMKYQIKDDNPEKIATVLDGWSEFHHGYIGVNIHYINKTWERRKINIACTPMDTSHTGQAMADFMIVLLNDWEIQDKDNFFLHDSAAAMIKMFEFLIYEHGDCGNHTLQLVVNDQVFSMASIKTIILKLRAICSYQNRSVQFAQALITAQEDQARLNNTTNTPTHLHQDVLTRWNSTYEMLESANKILEALRRTLEDPKWSGKIYYHETRGSSEVSVKTEVELLRAECELIPKIVSVLKIFKEVTLIMSSDQASISQLIPVIKILTEALKPKSKTSDIGVVTYKKNLLTSLKTRFSQKEWDKNYTHATLLDPRYKKTLFCDETAKESAIALLTSEMKDETKKTREDGEDTLVSESAELSDDEVEDDFSADAILKRAIRESEEKQDIRTSEGKRAEDALNTFLNTPVEKSCLLFWKAFEEKAEEPADKTLARLAKKYLTPPPTSTDVERLFSVTGLILTEKRNRLLPDNLEKILFLRENIESLNFEI